MIRAPRIINGYFPDTILQPLNVAIKPSIPYSDTCPLCHHPAFTVDRDLDGIPWYYCTACRFAGGAVELYMAKYKTGTPDAINLLIEASRQPNLYNLCSATDIERCTNELSYLRKIHDYWAGCRDMRRWSSLPECMEILQILKLWPGSNLWPSTLGHIIGFSSLGTLVSHVRGTKKSAKRQQAVLTVWEDMPGHIHTFGLIHKNGSCSYVTLQGMDKYKETGLCLLRDACREPDVAFAIGDPLTALHLQHFNFYNSRQMLPVVGWREGHSDAWRHLQATTVVFWKPILDWSVFHAARQVREGIVADWNISSAKDRLSRASRPDVFLNALKKKAVPWIQALKKVLLRLPALEARTWLSRIGMTPAEWKRILDICTPKERGRLARHAESAEGPVQIPCGGYQIIVRDGKWWCRSRQGSREELLSDTPIRISSVVHHTKSGKTIFAGMAFYGNKPVRFEVEENLLRKDAAGYFRNLLTRHGVGYPMFSPRKSLQNMLVDVALSLFPPVMIVNYDRVGWEPRPAEYKLPMLSITEEEVRPAVVTVSPESMPGFGIKHAPLELEQIQSLVTTSSISPAFWAAYAAILYNAGCKMIQAPFCNISLVGSGESSAETLYKYMKHLFGLLELNIRSVAELRQFRDICDEHDFPAAGVFSIDRPILFRDWAGANNGNGLFRMGTRMAFSVSVYQDWNFVVCPSEPSIMPPFVDGLVTHGLQWLIRFSNKHNLSDTGLIPAAVDILADVKKHIIKMYPGGDNALVRDVFMRAKRTLCIGSPVGPANKADRFLYFLFKLIDDQIIKIDKCSKDTGIILVDRRKEIMDVNLHSLARRIRRLGLLVPKDETDWMTALQNPQVLNMQYRRRNVMPVRLDYWLKVLHTWTTLYRGALSDLESFVGSPVQADS